MHPLRIYIDDLKRRHPGEQGQLHIDLLAGKIGVTPASLYNVHNPNQSKKLSIEKSLRLELATNGAVPASSTCPIADEVIALSAMVLKQRNDSTGKRKNGVS